VFHGTNPIVIISHATGWPLLNLDRLILRTIVYKKCGYFDRTIKREVSGWDMDILPFQILNQQIYIFVFNP
jgi:hypothetical protein